MSNIDEWVVFSWRLTWLYTSKAIGIHLESALHLGMVYQKTFLYKGKSYAFI